MKIIFMNDIGVNLDSANLMYYFFLKDKFDNEVWDLSPIYYHKNIVLNIKEAKKIYSLNEFDDLLASNIKKTKVIIITNMADKPWKLVQKIVKKYNIISISTQKNNFFDILRNKLAFNFKIKIDLKKRIGYIVWKYRLTRMLYSIFTNSVIKFDYQISCYNSRPETVKKFIKGHNVKYDEFLLYKDSKQVYGDFILFIDCALYDHPIDYRYGDNCFDKKLYIKNLNLYFDYIEKKFNMPVMIALHPISYNYLNESSFLGRKVFYGKTAELIHQCKYIISHYSTSLINAIFEKKPVVIISSKQIENSKRRRAMSWGFAFAKECKFNIDYIDNPSLNKFSINIDKYIKFEAKYLVNQKLKNKSNSDILFELINEIDRI